MTIFFGGGGVVQHVYCATFMLAVSHNVNPIIYTEYTEKNLNNILNQNVNVTKRAKFATFAISIVDILCLLQKYKWNTIKIRLPRLMIDVPYASNFMTILDLFISR